jgi:hypothetical protein
MRHDRDEADHNRSSRRLGPSRVGIQALIPSSARATAIALARTSSKMALMPTPSLAPDGEHHKRRHEKGED